MQKEEKLLQALKVDAVQKLSVALDGCKQYEFCSNIASRNDEVKTRLYNGVEYKALMRDKKQLELAHSSNFVSDIT